MITSAVSACRSEARLHLVRFWDEEGLPPNEVIVEL